MRFFQSLDLIDFMGLTGGLLPWSVCAPDSFFLETIKVHHLPPIHVGHCRNDFCYQQQQTCSYWEGCCGQQHCNSYQDGCQFKIMVDAAQRQWYLHWCFLLTEEDDCGLQHQLYIFFLSKRTLLARHIFT